MRLSQTFEPGDVQVECVSLKLADPTIPASIDQSVTRRVRRVTLLPYFLVAGHHVAVDTPKVVGHKSSEYPDVDIQLSDYLGATDCVVDMLSDMPKRAIT
jgi:sirohydrochlorin ferrochelatase